MYIDIMAALLGSAASSHGRTIGEAALLAGIEHLARLCYRHYDWGWENLDLFDWLATFLRRRHGIRGITAQMLLAAAENAEEHGAPFLLPGLHNPSADQS